MPLIGASGVQCGLSRGEVCLGPVADEVERLASVMRFLSCGLLSLCAGLLRGMENVREVLFGACVARGPPVVLVLCCLRAALQADETMNEMNGEDQSCHNICNSKISKRK